MPPTPPLPSPNPMAGTRPSYQPVEPYEPQRFTQPNTFSERMINRIPAGGRQVNLPANVPRFLGDRATIFYAWMASMLIIGFDEWHNLHILPRPARLWDTSLVYGLLAAGSVIDPLVPIFNAFAVGYTLTLLWQYYNGDLTPKGITDTGTGGANTPSQAQPSGAKSGVQTPQQIGSSTHGGVQ